MAVRQQAADSLKEITKDRPGWQIGILNTPSGLVPLITAEWSGKDRWGQVRARMTSFRMDYIVRPGLYAIGKPDASSEIFVSANYKLSFDILRRELKGLDGWILVLDTRGINVWCAAGKGTFGTDELVKRIIASNLSSLVTHRRVIIPQLGATGVKASEVKKKTGFSVCFGPVEASDIKGYFAAGRHAMPSMRRIRFGLAERLVLVPMELNQAMRIFPLAALIILALFGLQPSGILFYNAWFEGWSFLALTLVAVFAGAVLTPALLPVIPSRSFAMKGLITGAALTAPLLFLTPTGRSSWFFQSSALVLFPLLSSYLALQFTGATTFTTISGVKKELAIWLPIYIAGLALSIILIILYKIQTWGLL
ncbi:MAG: acetyl-CoA synthase subunit gamma [Spirochaetes bacterium]|nr:acetyl-CoA synthase subunit gamma [Spirochaetota bacterium]